MKIITAIAITLTLSGTAQAMKESEAQAILCADKKIEVALSTGARADCVDETHAIEVDFTGKWAEAIGQSLHYASALEKKPGIFLICKSKQSKFLGHKLRLEQTIAYWQLPIDVWFYSVDELEGGD